MMHFYFDASALGKRYAPEPGTALVNTIFETATPGRIIASILGVSEVLSILVRRHNSAALTDERFQEAVVEMEAEALYNSACRLESVTDDLIRRSLPLIPKHSVNASDAIVLRSALDVAETISPDGDAVVLVASDLRLLRAAGVEGLTVFNPEVDHAPRLEALLGTGSRGAA